MPIDTGPGNSTIQAYLQSKALAQSRERMQQMHDEAQAQLKELHQYHTGQLDVQQKQLDLAKQTLSQHLQELMMQGISGGTLSEGEQQPQNQPLTPPQISPQGGAPSLQSPQNFQSVPQPSQPAGVPITFNDPYEAARSRTLNVQTPIQRAQTQAQVIKTLAPAETEAKAGEAGAVAKATSEAQLATASSPQALALGLRSHAMEMDKLNTMGANALAVAKIHGQYGLAEANTHANATIQAAHIANDLFQNPDVLQGAFNSILGGQGDLKDLPPKTKLGVEKMFSSTFQNGVVPDEKMNKDLTNIKSVEELLKQYYDLAKNYSKDAPQGGILKAAAGHIPGVRTDIRTKMDALMSQGGILARQFDPQSRIAKSLIEQQQAGLFDPYATVQQNLDKIEAHRQTINTEIGALFAGMPDDEKNVIMGRRGINLFGGFGGQQSPAQNVPAGRVVVINPSGKTVHIPQAQLKDALSQGYKVPQTVQ